MGIPRLDAPWVHQHGPAAALARILEIVGEHPAYVTFDIDCLDPAFAPGTGTPVWGGLASWQAAALLRGLAGYIAGELHTDVAIAPDPLNCVARGTAISLSEGKYLSAGFRDATPKVWNRRLNHSHDPFTGE